jgi:signal transduction histidine kinase/CheY-like chemotaxis protein
MPYGLKGRSLVFCALLLIGTVATLSSILIWQDHCAQRDALREAALVAGRAVAEVLEPYVLLNDADSMKTVLATALGDKCMEVAWIVGRDGQTLVRTSKDDGPPIDIERFRHAAADPRNAQIETIDEQVVAIVPIWEQVDDVIGVESNASRRPLLLGHVFLLYTQKYIERALVNGILTSAVVSVVVLAVGFAATLVLIRRLVNPIVELADAAKGIAAGDLSRRAREDAAGEVGVLAGSFNHMADSLSQYTRGLEGLVTERTAALADALRRAESAAEAKTQFLANMSHEIRTPMTAILGYTDILLEQSYGRQAQEPLAVIKRNGEHLLQIINDILDLSKIEAGRVQMERLSFSPLQMLAEVKSLMRVRAESKHLSLKVEFASEIPERVESDPTRVRQILINLVGNAIKFTEAGGVKLVLRLFGPGSAEVDDALRRSSIASASGEAAGRPAPADGESYLQFEVVDTGIGMSSAQVTNLFQPFYQADSTMSRRFGGSGLGLIISRRLAEMLGGTVLAESELGKGSAFRFIMPVGRLEGVARIQHPSIEAVHDVPPPPARVQSVSLAGRRILLAEDGPDNQRLIDVVLRKAGAQVTIAENGQVAVDCVRTAQANGKAFDVILMDMQMPVLDGYGATGQLRNMGYDGPIIALTAHAMSGDREKCLAAGCSGYATKPLNRQQLLSTIQEFLDASVARV